MLTLPDYKEKQVVFVQNSIKKKIQFSNDNLVLRDTLTNKICNRVSCHKIFVLFIVGDITITSVFLRKSQRYGFTIIFLTRNFSTYGIMGAKTEGNFLLRKKQYYIDEGLTMAKHIIYNKLGNQLSLLKKIRNKTEEDKAAVEIIERYQKEIDAAEEAKTLLGIEGYSAKIFFQTYFHSIVNWKGRKPRSKQDEINLLLDIGYTYLFNFIECHLRLYGFDVYKGFYHTLFYERKSLVCDIVEPFRCIIDHCIRKVYKLNQINKDDFGFHNGQYYLQYKESQKYTQIFFDVIIVHKDKIFKYVQSYYRAFMKGAPLEEYPVFQI